jgi:UTP--glucose-1-phosphate uridylyltransferase
MTMKRVTKAVFPVAGLGTRFLPATKASPKEMLPVVDKPLIQYAVEEAIEAGATELIFITGRNKRSIPDHFDKSYELESELESAGKQKVLEMIRGILPKNVSCIYIRQPQALGLGHAVLCAKPVVGNEHQSSVLGVEDVLPSETASYGIVDAFSIEPNLLQLKGIVEKPQPEDAPSTLAVVGRYVLSGKIFDCLEKVQPGKGGEIQLTDGIAMLMEQEKVLAYRFEGKRYDCGSKIGFMQANVELALKHPEISEHFAEYLKTIVSELK